MPRASWLDIDRPRAGRAALFALGVLAATNLAAGVVLSVRPERAVDFHMVVGWAADWLHGTSPFAAPDRFADYPPWAVVLLSPLAMLPRGAQLAVWILINLCALGALSMTLVRRVEASPPTQLVLALLLVATASARTLNQFSLASYALAVAGALSSSNVRGAAALGLALIKPQIAGVAWVWLVLSRQWGRAVTALAVPAGLMLVFAARVHQHPTAVVVGTGM